MRPGMLAALFFLAGCLGYLGLSFWLFEMPADAEAAEQERTARALDEQIQMAEQRLRESQSELSATRERIVQGLARAQVHAHAASGDAARQAEPRQLLGAGTAYLGAGGGQLGAVGPVGSRWRGDGACGGTAVGAA